MTGKEEKTNFISIRWAEAIQIQLSIVSMVRQSLKADGLGDIQYKQLITCTIALYLLMVTDQFPGYGSKVLIEGG